ncbi:MAG: hypothetical protein K1X67_05520 [Fimbriimonadaceae bacterium]|nr:hypothetical protein [Fimbriimonadaceae bacterium]
MKRTYVMAAAAVCSVFGAVVLSTVAMSQPTAKSLVILQTTTPGTPQVGHVNLSGTVRAGSFTGSGAGLTGIPTSALTGTMLPAQLNPNMLTTFGAQSITGVKIFSATPAFTSSTPFTVSSTSVKVNNLNADLLDGLDSTDLLNASNFTSGTIPDARLSSNVAMLGTIQTFTGAKTFSTAPAFTAAGVPFTVTGTGVVTNLNADKFDGYDSSDFINAGMPFSLTASVASPGSVLSVTNTGTGGTALYGKATGTGGIGVKGVAVDATGWGGMFTGGKGLYADHLNVGGALNDAVVAPLQLSGVPGEKISFGSSLTANIGITVGDSPDRLTFHTDTANSNIRFDNGLTTTGMIFQMDTGYLGVGTDAPTAALDVNGSLKADSLRLTDGAAANTVLLGADASGYASWGKVRAEHLSTQGSMLSKVTGGNFSMGTDGIEGDPGKSIKLSTSTNLRVLLDPGDATQGGNLTTYGPNGNENVLLGGTMNSGYVSVCDSNGTVRATMYSNGQTGNISATIKNFRVPDPEDRTKDIVYACVEGPEAAMYTRGTGRLVNGEAHIQLPDHFRKLASAEGITVLLTPRSRQSRGIIYEDAGPSGFSVYELEDGKGTYEFDWEIKAVRKGYEDYEVSRPWDSDLTGDRAKQWTARVKSIESSKATHAAKQLSSSMVALFKKSIGGQK